MFPILTNALAYLSRVCGFETVDTFPQGHVYARTHWNPAYFDIASDLKPDQIERSLCDKIINTPIIFVHIANPTPGMQRALMSVIETRMRRSCGHPTDLVAMLVNAYRSPYTIEAIPGLRATIERNAHEDAATRTQAILEFLAFDVIEAQA
jgi:hypothetical protein